MRFTLLSCSLDPQSRSHELARLAQRWLQDEGHEAAFADLRAFPLAPFDNDRVYQDPSFAPLSAAIREADGVLLAVPVYNWAVGSVAKNLIEATGSVDQGKGVTSAWFDQLVTFLCSGGLPHSYTAHAGLAMSLMLDFKCVINPYHVYASGRDWDEAGVLSAAVQARLRKTLQVKVELARALKARSYRSGWEL